MNYKAKRITNAIERKTLGISKQDRSLANEDKFVKITFDGKYWNILGKISIEEPVLGEIVGSMVKYRIVEDLDTINEKVVDNELYNKLDK
jgi:hypothetical protein